MRVESRLLLINLTRWLAQINVVVVFFRSIGLEAIDDVEFRYIPGRKAYSSEELVFFCELLVEVKVMTRNSFESEHRTEELGHQNTGQFGMGDGSLRMKRHRDVSNLIHLSPTSSQLSSITKQQNHHFTLHSSLLTIYLLVSIAAAGASIGKPLNSSSSPSPSLYHNHVCYSISSCLLQCIIYLQ